MSRPIRQPEEILACRSLLRVLEGKPQAAREAVAGLAFGRGDSGKVEKRR